MLGRGMVELSHYLPPPTANISYFYFILSLDGGNKGEVVLLQIYNSLVPRCCTIIVILGRGGAGYWLLTSHRFLGSWSRPNLASWAGAGAGAGRSRARVSSSRARCASSSEGARPWPQIGHPYSPAVSRGPAAECSDK